MQTRFSTIFLVLALLVSIGFNVQQSGLMKGELLEGMMEEGTTASSAVAEEEEVELCGFDFDDDGDFVCNMGSCDDTADTTDTCQSFNDAGTEKCECKGASSSTSSVPEEEASSTSSALAETEEDPCSFDFNDDGDFVCNGGHCDDTADTTDTCQSFNDNGTEKCECKSESSSASAVPEGGEEGASASDTGTPAE